MHRFLAFSSTRLIAGVALSGLLLLGFGASAAIAAESTPTSGTKEEVTISPASSKIEIEPGQMKSGELTVYNTGEKEFSFVVYARPYSVETEEYTPNYSDTPARSNLYRWVQFDTTEGQLKPGENRKINYTILVPRNADAGGQYGVLFVETVADNEGQVVARNKRVGSIVRLTVGGDIKRTGRVDTQSIPWLQTRPPLTTEARVENSGNADFDASVTMRVTTVFGREVYKATSDYAVYPDKPRQIATVWEGSSVLGLYHVEQTVDVLGEESKVSSYVLMIPRWALLVLIMAAIAGGVYAAYRRLR